MIYVELDELDEVLAIACEVLGLEADALVPGASRIRDRQALAAEVAALEADADDRAEMSTVASLMEQFRARGDVLEL